MRDPGNEVVNLNTGKSFYNQSVFNSHNDVSPIRTTGLRFSLTSISLSDNSLVLKVQFTCLLITVSETRRLGPSISSLCTESLKNHLATLTGII